MRIALQTDDFMVVDDFLTEEDANHVYNYFRAADFRAVHQQKWIKAFRLSDGTPLWSDVFLSQAVANDNTSHVFPSSLGLDPLIATMLRRAPEMGPYIGRKGTDWDYFFCRPYIYPSGCGLSWHTDGRGGVAGAYVYYAHKRWSALWGSELLIDGSGDRDLEYPEVELYGGEKATLGLHLDAQEADDRVMAHGVGHYVLPRPNRLVVLKPGLLHRIQRVDPRAGDHLRLSVTGFFVKEGHYPT